MYQGNVPVTVQGNDPCLVYNLLSPGEMARQVPACAHEAYSQPNQVAVELYDIETHRLQGITVVRDNWYRPQLSLGQHENLITWDKTIGWDRDGNDVWQGRISVPFGSGVISCQVISVSDGGGELIMQYDVAVVLASKLGLHLA